MEQDDDKDGGPASVYSVVFREEVGGTRFEVLNIVGERKTLGQIAKDLHAAARKLELGGSAVKIG